VATTVDDGEKLGRHDEHDSWPVRDGENAKGGSVLWREA
jgi:hypothetical protein